MNPRIDLFSPDAGRSREVEAEIDVQWPFARLKVVEDQRAADLETIEALSRALAARDEMIARMAKHAELEEARIACRDLKIESLIAKDVRSDADLAKHRKMDEYLREEVARLHVENARLRADLAKEVRIYEATIHDQNETTVRLSRENERLRSDLAEAGKALDELTKEAARKDAWIEAQRRTIQAMGRRIHGITPEEWDAAEIGRALARAEGHHPAGAGRMISDPGPFGIDTPDYSDRDREMFVLGYEFAEMSRDIRQVTAGYIPPCKMSSSDRTIHEANLPRLLKIARAADLDYQFRRSSDGWCRLHVRRRDA